MLDYQLNIKRLKLKISSQGPSWFPEKIREKLRNKIYWCSIIWDQLPFVEKNYGNEKTQDKISQIAQKVSESIKKKIRVILPGNSNGFVSLYYLWANQKNVEPSDPSGKPNLLYFGKHGLELWRGSIEGTLHNKIWIFESNSELRKIGEIINDIFKGLSTETITEFTKVFIEKLPIGLYSAIIYSIGTIVGKILKSKDDDLVSVYESSRLPDQFPRAGQYEDEIISMYKTDLTLRYYTQYPESRQLQKISYDSSQLKNLSIKREIASDIDFFSIDKSKPPIGIDVPVTKRGFYKELNKTLSFMRTL